MAYIYLHRRKDTGEIFYVGYSLKKWTTDKLGNKKPSYRMNHKKGRNDIWNKIVNKTDYDIILYRDNLSKKDALKLETKLIKQYGRINLGTGTLANLTNGGENNEGRVGYYKGKKFTKKHKENLSKSQKGEKNSFYGKKHTEETKQKISESQKNKIIPDNVKIKIAIGKGKLTEEQVIFIRNNENGNIKEFCDKFNVTRATIYNILNRKTWKHI